MRASISCSFLVTILAIPLPPLAAEERAKDWPQWRGPNANGASESARPPLEWSEERNIRWKVEVPGRGNSVPIIWGERVFLTTAIDTGKVDPSLPRPEDQPERVFGIRHPNTEFEFVVLCLDRASGKTLWQRTATRRVPHEGHHGDNDFASASPTTDGKRLFCWFGSAGLYCYDLEGNKLWERDLGKVPVGASLGEGCSPVHHAGRLVIVRDHSGPSSIETLDAKTGATLWRRDRDEGNAWATPAIAEHDGRAQVVTTASNKVRAYDLESGDIVWECGGLTGNAIPCPVVGDGFVYCMSGYQGYALLALPVSATGDLTGSDRIAWSRDKGTSYVPSPVLAGGALYYLQSNQNLLSRADARTGELSLDRERLPELGRIYASPVAASGRIYVTDCEGRTLVLKQGGTLEILATNKLDAAVHASPALAGDALFLRGRQALYCIAEE